MEPAPGKHSQLVSVLVHLQQKVATRSTFENQSHDGLEAMIDCENLEEISVKVSFLRRAFFQPKLPLARIGVHVRELILAPLFVLKLKAQHIVA